MAFSQSTIVYVSPPSRSAPEPAVVLGLVVAGGYVVPGLRQRCGAVRDLDLDVDRVPDCCCSIAVGTVGPGEQQIGCRCRSADEPPNAYAEIAWDGGLFESSYLVGFYVYGSACARRLRRLHDDPDGPRVHGDASRPAAREYSWTAGPLTSGVWTFAVVPYDAAGNSGTLAVMSSVTIGVPPIEPCRSPTGRGCITPTLCRRMS